MLLRYQFRVLFDWWAVAICAKKKAEAYRKVKPKEH
jgi:hypothetical protein